jgi:hypothetical protein
MDTLMTANKVTPLRSLRQILAEIRKSKLALDGVYFNIKKKQVWIRKYQARLDLETDADEMALLEVRIQEKRSQITNTMDYVEGAIRKIHAYVAQYKQILQASGKEAFSEEDFEKEEERYHIMTAFQQALCSARARGGQIDEGNYIYFHQIGINGTAAQVEINAYLQIEAKMLEDMEISTFANTLDWLEQMAEKYKGCSLAYATRKGMNLLSDTSLHT